MTTLATLYSDIETLMPFTGYTDTLKASFVRIAEAEIRRKVRIGPMEVTDDAFAVSSRATELPSGFISMRSVSCNQTNAREMDYLPPARLRSALIFDEEAGNPRAYTIEGTTIVVAPVPSSATLTLVYYKMFDALTTSTATNWLLTNAYDVYLYGSLRAAAEWALSESKEAQFALKFEKSVEEINLEHRWSRMSGSALVRTGGTTP